jgi:hypothetical protein
LLAPRAVWRRPLSADSPSVMTYAGSSNAPNQAASRCVGSNGHGRPPSGSWQVPARRASVGGPGRLDGLVRPQKKPRRIGLKGNQRRSSVPSLAGGSENSRCALSALPSIRWDLERGQAVSFFGKSRVGHDAPHPLRRDKSRPVDSTAAGRGAAAIPSCPGSHIRALRARCKEGRGGLRDQASR